MTRRIGFCGVVFLLVCAASSFAQQPNEESVRTAVEAYRRMWQAMTPEQRKTIVDAGGGTPERYEQTLRIQLNGGGRKPSAAAPEGVNERQTRTDMDAAVKSSVADLNTVRDANLIRLREEACPPEVALEVAALRSRQSAAVMPPPAALLALADNWFQRTTVVAPPDPFIQPAAPQPIDTLLGSAPPARPADPARVNAEIERLLVACKQ